VPIESIALAHLTEKPPTRKEVRIAVALAAALLFFVVILNAALSDVKSFDFAGFYTGAILISHGNASKLYDLDEQARIEREVFNRQKLLIVNHPPFEALLFAAFAKLSYTKAYILWGAINVCLWTLFQHLLRRYAPTPKNPYRYLLLCSLFFPLWTVLILGQTAILLLLLFSLTFVCLKRGRDFAGGVFLGLGLFKFPIVLPFAFICLLRGKWRLMAGFAVAASALGALSLAAVGTSGVRLYADLLIDIIRNPDNSAYISMRALNQMPTIKGVLAAVLASCLTGIYINVLAAVISGGLVLLVAWRWRQEVRGRGERSLELMFAAALAVSQVVAPHMYSYDLTLMLLAILLVIGSPQWSQKSVQRVALTSIIMLLYCPPVYTLLLRWNGMYILAGVVVAFAFLSISLARNTDGDKLAGGLTSAVSQH
jgi:Glycosyltransferase family 87